MLDAREELRTKGYALMTSEELPIDPSVRQYEAQLAKEWEDLEVDKYLQNGARFRERRYDRFHYVPSEETISLKPHQPYFQSSEVNNYGGGVQRDVAPLTRSTLDNPLLYELIRFDFAQFPVGSAQLDKPWDVQCHQFRIIGRSAELGEPTPEGPHRDEVHFGAIHLMSRTNAGGGVSQVYGQDRQLRAELCLMAPMDTMFWSDEMILHAVTPITVLDDEWPAIRDVLILGYKCSS